NQRDKAWYGDSFTPIKKVVGAGRVLGAAFSFAASNGACAFFFTDDLYGVVCEVDGFTRISLAKNASLSSSKLEFASDEVLLEANDFF
ncbi:hypothetical protein, partial [Vibrio sp. F13]|uniref:hypothetical protein n=1 Tax=Vibrio sp. F13 TaxID=2070777 RepID=UPI0019D2AB9C